MMEPVSLLILKLFLLLLEYAEGLSSGIVFEVELRCIRLRMTVEYFGTCLVLTLIEWEQWLWGNVNTLGP